MPDFRCVHERPPDTLERLVHTWDPSMDLSGPSPIEGDHSAGPGPLLELDTASIRPVGPPLEEMSSSARGLAMLWDELEPEEEPWLVPDDEPIRELEGEPIELPMTAIRPIH